MRWFRSKLLKKAYGYDTCLTGDTKISLLNGTEVPISDLVGLPSFWVYSTKEDGTLRPGLGSNARMTVKNSPVVSVLLDNGQAIKCTPSHPFLTKDGQYKRADELSQGESLMPLYRDRSPIADEGNAYERTYQPSTDSWIFTHRFVEARCPKGYVRHHKDFNRFNNSPDNIQLMTWEDHQKLHQEVGIPLTEKGRAARRRNALKLNEMKKGVPLLPDHRKLVLKALANLTPDAERRKKNALIKAGSTWAKSSEGRRKSAENLRTWVNSLEGRKKSLENVANWKISPDWRKKISEKSTSYWSSNREEALARLLAGNRSANHFRWHVKRGIKSPECSFCAAVVNHKVVSVTSIGTADVYDITVEKYHNFALSAGVFVHNSGVVNEENQTNQRDTNKQREKVEDSPNPANIAVDGEALAEFPELKNRPNRLPTRNLF